MLLEDRPGMWVPLTDEEFARAKELLGEITELAQSAPGEEGHMDRLTQLSLLIGTAAVGAAVAETEGPEAEKKWRAQQSMKRLGPGDMLVLFFRGAWRKWRQSKVREQALAQGKLIELHTHTQTRNP